ncbi:class I SAM-dependent methyltransferase [Govanella unica]|uniref:Class I SAM-dependent methyltransferase n=1 Tax=Govanella unica TaxID=2975056 RepID=A0A9X3Z817_9PROT|nr:class I SAM-dependent methyltransferase [Govania unica]MDA5194777.1 class I SAM-dependent methyltransferase [Govania unica]
MTASSMTPLAQRLIADIRGAGPMPVASFMAAALGDPVHGYYMTRDPFGARGDFITAPEVSQMFGEIIGLWVASEWQAMGSPPQVTLLELGPGRGTLMADALRALRVLPACREALSVRLVEMSPELMARQRDALKDVANIHWHASAADALAASGDSPVILLANEFLDALPIHQLVMTADGWRERLVDATPGGKLDWTLAINPTPLEALIPPSLSNAHAGALFELCPAALTLAGDLARHIKAHGGSALFIDYGHERPGYGDTLQALKSNNFADALTEPGEADLTAHVDFSALGNAAKDAGLAVAGPISQGRFLLGLGIRARAERLTNASPARAAEIATALTRLTAAEEMGTLFKVMALRHPDLPPSAGFAPEGES